MPCTKFARVLVLAATAAASFAAFESHASEGCVWLRLPEVERAFPQHAPWKDSVGVSGTACRFVGEGAKPTRLFTLSQRFHASTADAVDVARKLKEELREDYRIEPTPELGRDSFYYSPLDEADEALGTQTTYWVVQNQRLVLMGTLVAPPPLQANEKAALTDLLKKAVDGAQPPAVPDKSAEVAGGDQPAE
jgi:hypothetical protein